jgi:hypothetical protein
VSRVDACWRKLESYCLKTWERLELYQLPFGRRKGRARLPCFGIAAGTDRLNPQAALHVTISQREAGRLPPASVNEGK